MNSKSNNSFLCFETGIYLLIFMVFMPTLLSIILTFCFKKFEYLYGLIFALLGLLLIFLLRKTLFSKIVLTEQNISRIYRKKIIKTIKWENLVIIKAIPKRHLIFLETDNPKKELWKEYKDAIYFYVNKQKILKLKPFIKITNCPIVNLGILGDYYKKELSN